MRLPPLLVALFLPFTLAAEGLRIVGSDLLGSVFEPIRATAPGGEDDVWDLRGSTFAIDELREGRADVAILALPPGREAPADLLVSWTLAYQVCYVVASESVPLAEISYPALRRVFGRSDAPTTQWGGLGLGGVWTSRTIFPGIQEMPGHLASDLFRALVLEGGDTREGVARLVDVGRLEARVLAEPGSLLIAPVVPPRSRAIPVSRGGSVAFAPTAENIHAGDYPLRLPFVVAYRAESLAELRPWLRWLLGDDVARVLAEKGFVPLPGAARRQRALDLELR